VAAAFIDSKLAETLQAYLLTDKLSNDLIYGANAPLGTFSARAQISLALGLIDRVEYDEIHLVRKIRNLFAHEKHGISFKDDRVKKLCSKLQKEILQDNDNVPDNSRLRLMHSVGALALRLYHRPDWVKREKCHEKAWPKFCVHPDIAEHYGMPEETNY
jgi:mannitol operon repressor